MPRPKCTKAVASLVNMWDNERNIIQFQDIAPNPGSGKKYHWMHVNDCGCIHRWYTTVASMTSAVSIGCPICLGKGTNVRPCCAVKSLTGDPRFAAIADDWDPTNSGQPET